MIAQYILAIVLCSDPGAVTQAGPLVQLHSVDAVFPAATTPENALQLVNYEFNEGLDWSPLDTLELFAGLEGSKQPQDYGVNAQFGIRSHINWGVPLSRELGLGLQVGTALNYTDHAVRVTETLDGSSSRMQNFTTIGVFQRDDRGWVWGIVYDFLYEDDYDRVFLGQWRARAGYLVTESDEIGLYGMAPQQQDTAQWGVTNVRLRPLTQGSVYWRRTWEYGSQVGVWVGAAESHGQANIALGNEPPSGPRVVFGSDVHLPLNSYWAIFGEANFVTPAATGTVDAYLGFAYYPGGNARLWRNRAFSPVLPVANNTSFTTDLR